LFLFVGGHDDLEQSWPAEILEESE
jgi:predicted Zn-ribbon and HTH transcriptional regulator